MPTRGFAALGLAALSAISGVAAVSPARAEPAVGPAGDPAGDHGRMVLVLDSSGSMAEPAGGGQTKMQAAKQALTDVVASLPEGADVGLRVYGSEVFDRDQPGACTDSRLAVPLGADNRRRLTDAIAGFRPYGETPIAHALREAAGDVGRTGKRSIVLVSDGIATCKPDPCEVAADLAASGVDLAVDVVGLGVSGRARKQLQCIADQGNGTYYNVATAREISDTLTRVSQRAVRPFTLTGNPVRGTPRPDGAPELTSGQWTDYLGPRSRPEATRHYVLRRGTPGSTLHVVATTRGTPGAWDEVKLALTDPEGETCAEASDYRSIDKYSVLSAQAAVGPDTLTSQACWDSDVVGLRVERGRFDGSTRAPVAITVFEEPPATDVDRLPDPDGTREYVPPRVRGKASEAVAGTSFADAPALHTGIYRLDIVPGESQILKVPLDWGQQFTMRATFPAGTPGVAELTGVQGPFADVKMYSSLTGRMSGAFVGTESTTILPGQNDGELTAMSPVVRYRNRESYGDVTAYLPGDYYVVVSANASLDGESWVQPYRLEVEVLGEPSGAPTYTGGAEVQQPLQAVARAQAPPSEPPQEPSPTGDPSASPPAQRSADTNTVEDSQSAVPVVMGAGAAVLVVGVTAAIALRRGRSRSS